MRCRDIERTISHTGYGYGSPYRASYISALYRALSNARYRGYGSAISEGYRGPIDALYRGLMGRRIGAPYRRHIEGLMDGIWISNRRAISKPIEHLFDSLYSNVCSNRGGLRYSNVCSNRWASIRMSVRTIPSCLQSNMCSPIGRLSYTRTCVRKLEGHWQFANSRTLVRMFERWRTVERLFDTSLVTSRIERDAHTRTLVRYVVVRRIERMIEHMIESASDGA